MQNENAPRRVWHRFYNLPSSFFILLVRVYQLTLSPAKTVLLGPAGHCRFEPSCSQYAVEALKTHGALSGSWLAAKRICRCHPWGAHGEDPVPTVQSLKSKVQGLKSKEPAARSPRPKVPSPKSKNSAADLQVSNVGFL